ncbi:hypothetical protein ASF49_04745 [Methylobacterium sp. Leaf104]|uniref:hypothetical protein n=1 Tax=Methylobacterium TaxID=407 RepID=UPI0006FF18B7|nr:MULTISPECIES: hypothetical protein [Methylobacterium]KQP38320.1 hypothetical protein ASF49_04745 [Methylobacterium sp. Leaf104]MCI9880283.1 hypothetical protein [Methylobacterium goesingense]
MTLSLQPVRIRTESSDEEGRLVLAEGILVAILVRLSSDHGAEAGCWFLEVGFGRLGSPRPAPFLDLAEALTWIAAQDVPSTG